MAATRAPWRARRPLPRGRRRAPPQSGPPAAFAGDRPSDAAARAVVVDGGRDERQRLALGRHEELAVELRAWRVAVADQARGELVLVDLAALAADGHAPLVDRGLLQAGR